MNGRFTFKAYTVKISYLSLYTSYSCRNSLFAVRSSRKDSCIFILWCATSITQPAIFEQWFEVRSRLVKRSGHTKPTSIEQSPCCKRIPVLCKILYNWSFIQYIIQSNFSSLSFFCFLNTAVLLRQYLIYTLLTSFILVYHTHH